MRCSLVNTGTLTRYDSLPGTGALLPRSGAPPLARRRRRLARWLSRRRPSSLLRRDGARQARPNLPECQRAANVPTVTHSTAPAPVEAVSDAGICARAGLTRVLRACLTAAAPLRADTGSPGDVDALACWRALSGTLSRRGCANLRGSSLIPFNCKKCSFCFISTNLL